MDVMHAVHSYTRDSHYIVQLRYNCGINDVITCSCNVGNDAVQQLISIGFSVAGGRWRETLHIDHP